MNDLKPITILAKNLLKQLTEIDNIYINAIPNEEIDNVDKTIALIRKVNLRIKDFGSNRFNSIDRQIEVQIFYSTNIEINPEIMDLKIINLFKDNGWDMNDMVVQDIDPDTNQFYSTFYFERNDLIQEKER